MTDAFEIVDKDVQRWEEIITPGRFAGQTVVVTGAGSGIGRATASRIAREGGRVIASDISGPRLDELATELKDFDVVTVVADVSTQEGTDSIVAAAGDKVDGLANVAGIMDQFGAVHEIEDDLWHRVMTVNVDSVMRLSRAFLPMMMEAGYGSIVNVASEAALRGSSAGVAYTASKHAVVGITKATSVMYGPLGIRTNAVAPGGVITNIVAEVKSEMAAGRLFPMFGATSPPPAQADQLAASITFLLSKDATNISGVVLASDGGWSAI